MARTALTPQRITASGTEVVPAPANVDGHSIPLYPGMVVLVRNEDVADKIVTVPTPMTIDGLAVADLTITVTAGEDRHFSLGTNPVYAQADGTAWLNFDSITSVSVALMQV